MHCSLGRAQLRVSVSTDKAVYQYGETITLVGTLTNLADTTVMVGQDYQGPVGLVLFDNTGLPKSFILPTHWQYQYLPHMSYRSVFKIDGARLGLPNEERQHFLVCYFSWDVNGSSFSKRDSVMISQPVFYGGQLYVEYSVHTPPSEIQSLLDSMHATVVNSSTYSGTVSARWQTSGFILDSLVARYTGDSRLSAIRADRSILPPTTIAQTNQKPVFVWHSPAMYAVSSGIPITFRVSAYDPEGEPVTFTWKRDGVVARSGADTSYTTTFIGPYGEPHNVICIAADAEGLQDSVSFLFVVTDIQEHRAIPGKFSLVQNYPNPFNPSTTIGYSLSKTAVVTLGIYNVLGQEVALLVNGREEAGYYRVTWNASVPSGIHFYRLQAGEYVETKKMILLK